jgi:hypothetical protein
MYLYLTTTNSNIIISINKDLDKISNPINLWILKKYSDLRNEFINWMNLYELKNAIGILYKLVQILNNGYIKMGRNFIKGKESEKEWIESLSVMNYIIGFILNDFKSVMPFFCESQYMGLKEFYINKLKISDNFDKSIHLVESQSYITLNESQLAKSLDFDIIYNIITQIYQMRSSNNISLKKPVKTIGLIWDNQLEQRYSDRFKEYLGMVIDECNILDLQIISKNNIIITKTIIPVKALFFKKYGKSVQPIFDEMTKWDSIKLDKFINDGGIYKFYHPNEINYDEFVFDYSMFNHTYKIDFINSNNIDSKNFIFKEFDFGLHKDKIILLLDKSWDESNDKIYYYRLVATSIQKSRKEAGLHPWDNVVAHWKGLPKYPLETDEAIDYIEKITRIKLLNSNNISNLIFSNHYENIDIDIILTN